MKSWQKTTIAGLDHAPVQAFSPQRLKEYLEANRSQYNIPPSLQFPALAEELVATGHLHDELIKPLTRPKKGKAPYKPIRLYTWRKAHPFDVALALRPRSYLSHATAAEHHGLLPVTSTIYVNQEQSEKPQYDSQLSQSSVAKAFANAPRVSNLIYGYEGREIVFLAGKHSREHEVINSKTPTGTNIRVTSLERTLIDLAVRPAYARGLADILGAYKNAKDRISIKKMLEILQVLDHAYPYHQAVGFYLERAGVSRAATRPLHKLGLNLDFYLGNRIAKAGFDEYWRIHYPSDLDGDETKLASKFRRQKRDPGRKKRKSKHYSAKD